MLSEIYCEEFYQKKITFSNNLNVVLGTNTGDNSIGKSTFLLVVDFVFGGNTYSKAIDILNNIGSHDIYFKFIFDEDSYYFCRNNYESSVVWICNENYEKQQAISLAEYCEKISNKYNLNLPFLSFRDAVGRYIRVYGKENCNEKRPLHYIPKESNNKSVITLLKLFNRYKTIAELENQSDLSKEALQTFNKAQSLEFVSKIGKRQYQKNIKEIERLELEIKVLSSGLEHGLLDVDAAASERAIQIKSELSRAKRLRSGLYSKLRTINENGEYQFSNTTETYNELLKYFPQANLKHISEIESFHKKISSIFKKELASERRKLYNAIEEYNSIVDNYETQLKELIQNPKLSKIILQQHSDALKSIDKMKRDNNAFLKSQELKLQKKQDEDRLLIAKKEQLGIIEKLINNEMEQINATLYKEEYNSPLLHFSDSDYLFTTPNDTGTGIAYKGLVVFDLSIKHLTNLPILVHDSVVLKQISDDAIENIMNQYIDCGKQTIIALDKQESYSEKTAELLDNYSILELAPNGRELFGRSWGKKSK